MAGKVSKPFRVAAEGQTVDGRTITRDQITQMAATYNPARYGARLWNNHLRGVLPDSLFSAMGDVVSLEAKEFDAESGAKKMGLYAVVSALPNLLAMLTKSTNIFWSIEMAPNFAGSGQAYMVGLAPTDDPASLWTEPAKFSASGIKDAVLGFGADSLYSPPLQATVEWKDEFANPAAGLLDWIKNKFSGSAHSQAEIVEAVKAGFGEVAERFKTVVHIDSFKSLESRVSALETGRTADQQAFTALKTQLSNTGDGTAPRPPASGGGQAILTDC